MGEWMFEDGREPTAEEMEFHYFRYEMSHLLSFEEVLKS